MEKVKVLLISRYFGPANMIAAIRTTKLAKYLHKSCGCEVTVIAGENLKEKRDPILESDLRYVDKIYRAGYGEVMDRFDSWKNVKKNSPWFKKHIKSKMVSTSEKGLGGTKKKGLFRNLSLFYEFLLDRVYFINAKKILKLLKKNQKSYDVIISSFGPHSSNLLGNTAKRYWPGAKWIGDFRDPIINQLTPALIKALTLRHDYVYSKKPDMIVGVSDGCLSSLKIPKGKKKSVITNGYDEEDIEGKSADMRKDRALHIVYCGSLAGGARDATPLWDIVADLIKRGKIREDEVCLEYAGTEGNVFLRQAAACGLGRRVIDYGYVSRDISLGLQQQADILLLITSNDSGFEGVVTGKIYEYMMLHRPICCIVNGNLAGSKVKKMVLDGNLGCCYEEASGKQDRDGAEAFLMKCMESRRERGTVDFNPNRKYIEMFTYKNLVKQFYELF